MSKTRTYTIPLTGLVTVDSHNKTVEVEVDLAGLPGDLQYDYRYPYPDDQTKWDEDTIRAFQADSLEHHIMRHRMGE